MASKYIPQKDRAAKQLFEVWFENRKTLFGKELRAWLEDMGYLIRILRDKEQESTMFSLHKTKRLCSKLK